MSRKTYKSSKKSKILSCVEKSVRHYLLNNNKKNDLNENFYHIDDRYM